MIFVKIKDKYFQGIHLYPVNFIKNFPSMQKEHSYSLTLIGLDGGIKNQWYQKVQSSEIFQKIDSMPMRISEIKN